jgi:hypothetical protein
MSRYLKGLALIGVGMLLLALVQLGAGQVRAQETASEFVPWQVNGERGMMGWRGILGHGMAGRGAGNMHQARGIMQVDAEAMHAAIAEALGISVAEFEAAHAEGKTVYALAEELDVDLAVVRAAMQAVHTEALAQAVADGLLTQEQAQSMLVHHAQMGNGRGGGMMGQGFGYGFDGHHEDCPLAGPAE